MRRALWILAPALLFLLVAARVSELGAIFRTLAVAAPAWILLAALSQVIFAATQSATYQSIFRLLEVEVPLRSALQLSLAMAFGSLASPIGTTSGIAYFVFTARRLGLPAPRALWTSLAYYLFDYTALLLVLAGGAFGLALHHDLQPSYLATVGIFGAAAVGALAIVGRSLRRPEDAARELAAALRFVRRVLARLIRRIVIDEAQIVRWTGEVSAALQIARRQRRAAAAPFFFALTGQALGMATLAASFLAIGHPLPAHLVVGGYAVGALFTILSVTPSGVGIVEGALTVTFTSLGVPVATAVAGTLLFRLFTIWLPIVAGFAAVRRMRLDAAHPGLP